MVVRAPTSLTKQFQRLMEEDAAGLRGFAALAGLPANSGLIPHPRTGDDYAGNTSALGATAFGASVTDRLEAPGDADRFRFSAQSGLISSFDTLADDHGNDATTTSTLAVDGASALGVIDYGGDWDWFRVTGMIGDPIRIDLTAAQFAQVILRAIDQYGNIIRTFNGLTNTPVSLVAPPEAHFVAIIGFDAAGNYATGSYSLSAFSIPDDHGDTLATATPVTIGGPAMTAVNEGGDRDMFSFEAQAGAPLVFNFLSLSEGGAIYALYDQYGRSLNFLNSVNTTSEYHSFLPTISGTYYLSLNPGSQTSFQIAAATDDYSDTLPTNGALVIDGPAVSARHDFDGDFDVFSISIAEAGTYRIEILPANFRQIKLLALYDAAGNLIEHRFATLPGEGLTLHVDTPGQYYVGVEEAVGLTTDDDVYQVWAYRVSADDYGETLATAGTLVVGGGPVSGALNYNEDRDWLRFEVQSGDVLRVEFTSTWAGIRFSILNALGVPHTEIIRSEYDSNVFNIAFLEGGAYYFAYGDPFGHVTNMGTGTYSIDMTVVPGESAFPAPLTIGTPAQGYLAWEGYSSSADIYAFTAIAGQTIRFDVDLDAGYWWKLSVWHINQDGVPEYVILDPLPYNLARGYTFGETGEYFVVVRGFQPTTTSTIDLGTYTLHTNVIADDAGSNPATAAVLILDGAPVTATVNYENDIDYFAITVDAGDVVRINVVHDQTITGLNWGDGRPVRFDVAGTYCVVVEGTYWEEVGGSYTITATSVFDDYRSDVGTSASVTVGGPAFVGQLEYDSDHDWVAVQLQAGEDYVFTISGSSTPGNHLNGTIDIYNNTGSQIASTGFNVGVSTQLVFTASYTGTHYLGAWGQISSSSSPFTLTAQEFTPPLLQTIRPGLPRLPDARFDHTHIGAANVINVYFAELGDEFGSMVSDGWFAAEIDAVMAVLSSFETYLNIDFQLTTFLPNADVILTTFDDPATLSTFRRADWDVPVPVIGFSYSAPTWTPEALASGGLGAATVLNAAGFALGLSFPHAPEGDSYAMDGVTTEFDYGDFAMNQGVYTIMSFNDGWATSPFGLPASDNFGWQATPMALDIAALQSLYGANATANAGNTVFALGDNNVAGTAWRAIWDTGGTDTITYTGSRSATIDLRPATLNYAQGGGGFLSWVAGIQGGFTIANGVSIENASGGGGGDTLIGNASANALSGGAGDDTLEGGAGGDVLSGGTGIDTASYANSAAGVTVNLTTGVHFGGEAQGDVLSGIENVLGSSGADFLSGDAGVNGLSGGAGGDQLFGFAGSDTLDGGAGVDQMFGGEGDDLYVVDNGADFAFEGNVAWGVDAVQAIVSFTLGQNIDNLTLLGSALVGQGNGLANVIIGNSSANTLFGFAGNDTLNGGAGIDQMFGGLGDDTYVVDNAADQTFEAQSTWGTDTAQASVTYQLGQNIDNLVLIAGAGALIGRGNILDNTITGNEAANTLFGFAGNDTLNGGVGADQLYGREGNDTYIVDNVGDVVSEANAAWGADTIQASVTYFLAPNLENLTLTGVAAINGNGNGLANIMIGNSAANNLFGFASADTLDGGAGADSLFGGEGDDLYIVDNAGDVGFEASAAWGTDLVQASVSHTLGTNLDNLTLTGAAAINGTGNGLANVITGHSAANALLGLGGADALSGGAGNDSLDGGAGDDAFLFAPGSGSDTVTGFIAGGVEDAINLSAYNGTGITWTISQVGADTVFAFSNGDQIMLTNVTAANLVQTDPFGFS